MELLRKTQTSGTSWSLLLSLLVIFSPLTLSSMEVPQVLEKIKPENTSLSVHRSWIVNHVANQVYLADLERAIDHILRAQLLKEKVFSGTKLIVLKNIMALLHYFNPLRTVEGRLYINKIYGSIKCEQEVPKSHLKTTVNNTELVAHSYLGSDYYGCRGSDLQLRGFNCSLWMLFHYLTVASSQQPLLFQPGAVLWVLQGYTHLFMGCSECYKNFWFYTQRHKIASVETHDEEILWLWRAHNHFNSDLAGSGAEDLFVPKMQFPQTRHCRKCRDNKGNWKIPVVLKYLKYIYSAAKLNMFGLKINQ